MSNIFLLMSIAGRIWVFMENDCCKYARLRVIAFMTKSFTLWCKHEIWHRYSLRSTLLKKGGYHSKIQDGDHFSRWLPGFVLNEHITSMFDKINVLWVSNCFIIKFFCIIDLLVFLLTLWPTNDAIFVIRKTPVDQPMTLFSSSK